MSASAAASDIDALFRLPLAEFTSARNALAAQLKRDGRVAEASEAKALPKPSASAWVVNQLYWRHRELFDRLLEAGERLRRAHAAQLTGDAARDSVNVRRDVMAELARIAADILREGSHNATRDLMRRVTSTLEALSSYGSLPGAPAAGRLTDDLEPPGFEAVAGLLPASEKRGAQIQMRLPHAQPAVKQVGTAARRDDAQRKSLIAAAKAAAREAQRNLGAARKQAERAAAKVEPAEKRAREIEGQRAKMEKQLARLSLEAKTAQADASEAAANATEARQAAEEAERALELARQRVLRIAGSEDSA
jgi:hypothetical protein